MSRREGGKIEPRHSTNIIVTLSGSLLHGGCTFDFDVRCFFLSMCMEPSSIVVGVFVGAATMAV